MTAFTRREAVRRSALLGAGLALSPAPGWARTRPPTATGGSFSQGVASGLPRRFGITLWTRLDGFEGDGIVEIEVARDPDFRHVIHRSRRTARPEADHTVQRRVRTRRLQPDEEYFYRFSTKTADSPVGRFQTLPPRDSERTIRIGFWTCQDFRAGFFGQHRALAAEDLDLVVCLGDYIYEDAGGLSRHPGRDDTTGANGDGIARRLEDYRAKYRLYRSDPALRALHERHAMVWLWDDHEVVNNYWREGAGGAPDSAFAQRQAEAYRAWFEHIPNVRIGGRRSTRIYRSIRVGDLIDLFLVDDRQYRDPQPCGDRPLAPCPDSGEPGRAMLGDEQKAWLMDGMTRTTAPWKVLVNGVMMMGLDQPAPGSPKFVDTWDGYEDERAELVSFWRDRGVEDVVVVTGDDHDGYAGIVTDRGHGGNPGAVEFVVPSVTSDNTSELIGDTEAGAIAGEQNALALNPHLVHADQRHHGYCVLEATAGQVEVEFKHARSREEPDTPVSTAHRFAVPRGQIAVERA